MSCAVNQNSLAQLSKHFSPPSFHSSATAPSLPSTSQTTLRTRSTRNDAGIEADWSDFQQGNAKGKGRERQPNTQIEAMPPTTFSTTAPWPTSTSTTFGAHSATTASLLDVQVSASPDDSSPFWSPESESYQTYIKTLALQSQGRKLSPPSAEGATIISQSTPSDTSLSSFTSTDVSTPLSSLHSSSGTPATTSKSAPHPLTFESSVHSAWDFERLFHEQRMWFGGVRLAEDGFDDRSNNNSPASLQEIAQSHRATSSHPPASTQERSHPLLTASSTVRSRYQHHRQCAAQEEEKCERTCGGVVVDSGMGLEDRQRIEYEALGARMKERLQLVENHFIWSK